MSLRPALGVPFFNSHPATVSYFNRLRVGDSCVFTFRDGFKFTLPRYFKRKYLSPSLLEEFKNYHDRRFRNLEEWYHYKKRLSDEFELSLIQLQKLYCRFHE